MHPARSRRRQRDRGSPARRRGDPQGVLPRDPARAADRDHRPRRCADDRRVRPRRRRRRARPPARGHRQRARAARPRVGAPARRAPHRAATATSCAAMIEDLLKDLIRTERRSLDLEDQRRAAAESPRSRPVSDRRARARGRGPARRAARGRRDHELRVRHAARMRSARPAEASRRRPRAGRRQLPGSTGSRPSAGCATRRAGLPAFLHDLGHGPRPRRARRGPRGRRASSTSLWPTSTSSSSRLAQLARDGQARTREQTYLQRIKERHEHVLARYRSLPRDA